MSFSIQMIYFAFILVPGGAPAAGPGGPNEDEKVS